MSASFAQSLTTLSRRSIAAEDKPITLVFIATGVLLTLLQYWNYLDTQRIEFSYEHVREWEDNGYKQAFDDVTELVRDVEAVSLANMPADLLDQLTEMERRQVQINRAMITLADDPRMSEKIDDLYYFFDKLSVCVSENLCDAELLRLFFREHILSFNGYTRTFVARKREQEPNFGSLTEAYAQRLRTLPGRSFW